MPYKVSVIVPVHNVASYIERCAHSLFRQTLDEIQFIFVDDHSEDDSIELLERVLDAYPQRRQQTVIMHLGEEIGIPAARKAGQDRAEGEYITQCDSDDYTEREMYETLYRTAKETDADIAECEFWQDNRYFSRLRKHPKPSKDRVRDFLDGRLWPYVWSRIVRADICRKVQFSSYNYLEDWYMSLQTIFYAQKISIVRKPLYHYCFNPTSVTHETAQVNIQNKMDECMANFRLVHDFIMQHHPVEEEAFLVKKVTVKEKCLPMWVRTGDRCWRRTYLDTFPEVNRHVLFCPRVPWERKMEFLYVLMGLFPMIDRLRNAYRAILGRTVLEGKEERSGVMCRRTK